MRIIKLLTLFSKRTTEFFCCDKCKLVFVSSDQHLSKSAEKAIYDFHQNNLFDKGYRSFLSRLTIPLVVLLKPGDRGLDFGCGPGPVLAEILREKGFEVSLFDPFYFNDYTAMEKRYDFICCTEVFEHFRNPAKEISLLISMLKPGGWLGVMTKLTKDQEAFKHWHYKNDPTHVCFFSVLTFQWLAKKYLCHLEFYGSDVIFLQKPENTSSH